MADRSWERGLHQMIETKEGLSDQQSAGDAGSNQLPEIFSPLPETGRHDWNRPGSHARTFPGVSP